MEIIVSHPGTMISNALEAMAAWAQGCIPEPKFCWDGHAASCRASIHRPAQRFAAPALAGTTQPG